MSMHENRPTPASDGDEGVAHCVTFVLGDEMFAIGIHHIREIIEYEEITTVPMMPVFVRGIINLRGAVVPVIDLSSRFGRPLSEIKPGTCIAILSIEGDDEFSLLGILLDGVREVVEIPLHAIEPPPSFGTRLRSEFIQGITTVAGRFVILLDVQKALSVSELSELADEVARAHCSDSLLGESARAPT
jgi:purine-binding chemotaxis protein CheW